MRFFEGLLALVEDVQQLFAAQLLAAAAGQHRGIIKNARLEARRAKKCAYFEEKTGHSTADSAEELSLELSVCSFWASHSEMRA